MTRVGSVELIILLLLVCVTIFGVLARKLDRPYPIIMVLGGLLLSFLPGIPSVALNPDLIFLVALPPLLYSSAWATSWRDFRNNLVSILIMAFGLVGFTVLSVALLAPKVFDGFDWRLGLLLGAIVAPTDAIAATTIARRFGLPARTVDILEGESLINDASGLLALQFALAILVEQKVPTFSSGLLSLTWLVVGGGALGLLCGWIVDRIERRIDDGPIETTLSILVPYMSYLAAGAIHASGVLAVVVCGLFLARRSATFFSPSVRLQNWSVWESLTFAVNGVIFVLLGLQLPAIRSSLHGYSLRTVLLEGGLFSALLILLRLVWVFPSVWIGYFIRTKLLRQAYKLPPARQIFAVGWMGMRGVVSLAAALAIPTVLADGSPFPGRNLILVLTFCVILVTLVLQGLTLPGLIRVLGLASKLDVHQQEEQEARRIAIQAVISHLENVVPADQGGSKVHDDIVSHYRQRLARLQTKNGSEGESANHERFLRLSLEALRIERNTVIRLRNESQINDEVLHRIERQLDLMETRIGMAGE